MSRWRRIGYALGSTGFQISDRIVVAIALYYYLPPGGRGLEPQVSQTLFLGVLTLYGAAMLIGRVFDALADPIVGHRCDRSRSRLGRRRSFMIYGIVPMLALPVFLFFPPGEPGDPLNGIWLAVILSLYFIAFTIYVAPYLALLPEIAPDPEDRTRLSTLLAILSFPIVMLFGAGWAVGLDWGRAQGLSSEEAIRWIVVISSLVGFGLCLGPILAVDETRHTNAGPSELSLREAFSSTLRDRAFLIYMAAQIFFILSINLLGPSLVYYATVALGRSEGFAGVLGGVSLISVIFGFAAVMRFSRAFGPKRTVVVANLLFSISVGMLWWLVPDVPDGPNDRANLILVMSSLALMGPAIAGFLVVPYLLIGQLIDADVVRSGASRAAMYFGMQGLMTKGVFGVSSALLAFLFARYGNSQEEPLGVLLIGPIAALFCLVSALIFLTYPEDEVLAKIREGRSEGRHLLDESRSRFRRSTDPG
ncbi:MAG: MFS transporter [bacterium]|nr:MFS transporter [bacterium]